MSSFKNDISVLFQLALKVVARVGYENGSPGEHCELMVFVAMLQQLALGAAAVLLVKRVCRNRRSAA